MAKTSTRTTSTSDPCAASRAHRWIIAAASEGQGGLAPAYCEYCQKERTFPTYVEPNYSLGRENIVVSQNARPPKRLADEESDD